MSTPDETRGGAAPPPPGGPDREGTDRVSSGGSPEQETDPIEPKELALSLADLIDERQGEDIVILDVSGPLAIADYFVIATARNSRHAQSMARELMQAVKSAGCAFRRVSGAESESGWVLLDFDFVVVHLFDAQRRDFYGLENLWSDVPRVPFEARPREERQPAEEAGTARSRPESGWPHSLGDL